jgi:hypothetical protein
MPRKKKSPPALAGIFFGWHVLVEIDQHPAHQPTGQHLLDDLG